MVEGSRESLFAMKGPMFTEPEEETKEYLPDPAGQRTAEAQGGMGFVRLALALREGDGEEACRHGGRMEEWIMTYEERPSPANNGSMGGGEALGRKRVAITSGMGSGDGKQNIPSRREGQMIQQIG